jgi:hypothetical protein
LAAGILAQRSRRNCTLTRAINNCYPNMRFAGKAERRCGCASASWNQWLAGTVPWGGHCTSRNGTPVPPPGAPRWPRFEPGRGDWRCAVRCGNGRDRQRAGAEVGRPLRSSSEGSGLSIRNQRYLRLQSTLRLTGGDVRPEALREQDHLRPSMARRSQTQCVAARVYGHRCGSVRYVDTIRHSVPLDKIAQRIQDPRVMHLVTQIIKAGGKVGVPQGGPFSLLAHVCGFLSPRLCK